MTSLGLFVDVRRDVRYALDHNIPVVALESTIVSHGMKYPINVETALEVERIIQSKNAVPATIAVIGGRIKVGLTLEELTSLGRAGLSARKLSRRDLAFAVGVENACPFGSTTVSATSLIASMVGIQVFATGGIGGAHRGAQETWDVSADLHELSRTPVIVISAGPKSLLDIGLTLEVLESLGVPVVTLDFDFVPAFYSRSSGHKTPLRISSPSDGARMHFASRSLGLQNGMLLCVPIDEPSSLAVAPVEEAIQSAVAEANQKGVKGAALTPFLLDRIASLTKGESLTANVALIKKNASVAAEVAISLSQLSRQSSLAKALNGRMDSLTSLASFLFEQSLPSTSSLGAPDVLVIGGCALDISCKVLNPSSSSVGKSANMEDLLKESHPSSSFVSCGGVARNIAEWTTRLKLEGSATLKTNLPLLVSVIGNDLFGKVIYQNFKDRHMRTDGLFCADGSSFRTALYCCILNAEGELAMAGMDMKIMDLLSEQFLSGLLATPSSVFHSFSQTCKVVVLDGNLAESSISFLCQYFSKERKKIYPLLFYEPVSKAKSVKILSLLHCVDFVTPNEHELFHMASVLSPSIRHPSSSLTFLQNVESACRILLSHGCNNVLAKIGDQGVYYGYQSEESAPCFRFTHIPAKPPQKIVSVTGAGDALVAGVVHGLSLEALEGLNLVDIVNRSVATYGIPLALGVLEGRTTPQLEKQPIVSKL